MRLRDESPPYVDVVGGAPEMPRRAHEGGVAVAGADGEKDGTLTTCVRALCMEV